MTAPMSDADVVVMTKEMASAMICDLSRRSLKEQHLAEDARYPLRCIATGRTVVVGAAEWAEAQALSSAFHDWWLNHHEDSLFFNTVMQQCPSIAASMNRAAIAQQQAPHDPAES